MKKSIYIGLLAVLFLGCSKSKPATTTTTITWDGNVVAYAPAVVSKSSTKRIFTHFMPWFETPATNNVSGWGEHWTMSNQVPPAQIASYYYPLNTLYFSNGAYETGPYATGDTNVIDYQLLLMKLSGIDGLFIDWPGTVNYSDFQKNVSNTNKVVSRLARVGLKYAIVYEDQNLQYVAPSNQTNQIAQAQSDMLYIQANYFSDPDYETFNGKPLLLDFGPFGPLQTNAEWNTIFSVMSTPPAFFPYEENSSGGTNAVGEFAWVQQSNLTNLNSFYTDGYSGAKISVAYPGFNSFYAQGGWPDNTPWTIPYTSGDSTTFQQTLSLALKQPGSYVQLVTWNDYGEGTMIEPTIQYQYSFLTTLQQKLGVQSLSQSDLQTVAKLYTARLNNILPTENPNNLNELDQVFYDIVSLKMDSANALLSGF